MKEFTIADFIADRDAALLSLDEARIRAMHASYSGGGPGLPADERLFWTIVHKSITSITSLPREFRLKSKEWLETQGSRALDDGELHLPGAES